MKLDTQAQQIVKTYLSDPTNQRSVRDLGTLYWSFLTDKVGALIREKDDVATFITREQDFVNTGVLKEIHEEAPSISTSIQSQLRVYEHLKVEFVSDWLLGVLAKITGHDRQGFLEYDKKTAQLGMKRTQRQIEEAQATRRDMLIAELSTSGSAPDKTAMNQIEGLIDTDTLQLEIARTRRSIARGAFFSVQQRRDLVARESQLKKETQRYEALVARVPNEAKRPQFRAIARQMGELFCAAIDAEERITRIDREIRNIAEKQRELSPIEVESRTREEIDYVRGLMILCAKRIHAEACSVLRPQEKFFTMQELRACFDRILEFDPRVLKNDRTSFLGKPSLLLIPGCGNALYDWKNNRLMVPLVPPAGSFMGSLATAVTEYRLDVDDEKVLITSYAKLPHLKGVRSITQIKGCFVKDYLIWTTSESKGFKVLPKETKAWFEHEIAPSKNDIYCPPGYQGFELTSEQFRDLLEEVEARLQGDLADGAPNDLWVASILNYQQGRFERAFECIKAFVAKEPGHAFGQYNLAHIGLKVSRKQEAAAAFAEFCKLNPQSWWATVARDHLRRLQMA